jgi:hypothetical protein
MTITNAFFGCPKKRWLKTPKARGCNNTLRLLFDRTYGRSSRLMYQLIGMRAKFLEMIKQNKNKVLVVMLLLMWIAGGVGAAVAERTFYGAADASAAIFLDTGHFVVADDESNVLLIYSAGDPEKPASTLDLNAFLGVPAGSGETDIEAASKVNNRIYWITSHGRNRNGKIAPNRYRFFCTQLDRSSTGSGVPKLIPTGVPCRSLVQQLLKHPSAVQGVLTKATRLDEELSKKERKKLAPKNRGLNIEGLMYYPPHKSLLVGLRNPLFTPDGDSRPHAIIFELKNPAEVIDKQKSAEFGQFLLWDLEGRAVRGMEYSGFHQQYYILAGGVDQEIAPALYCWEGDLNRNPQKLYQWPQSDPPFTPEGIATEPDTGLLWVFSDDGSLEIMINSPSECMEGQLLPNKRCLNKHLRLNARKKFRVRPMSLGRKN